MSSARRQRAGVITAYAMRYHASESARAEDISSLARSNSAAYFRVLAIDHPATDAPSILDFPKGSRRKERLRATGPERPIYATRFIKKRPYLLSRERERERKSVAKIPRHPRRVTCRPVVRFTRIVLQIGGGAQHHRERWLRRAVRTYRTPDGHGRGPK